MEDEVGTQVYLPTKGGIIGSPNPTLTLSTFADRLCPVCPETVQVVSPSVMQLKVAGKLSCCVYLVLGATVTTAQQITANIMRSLRTR